eukprot:Nitzschia sp. Nitz4//scaffold180_size44305//12238//12822//NITZ4_007236-RA/size44305-processed-gene-0.19-mRNA-1//-1//CDS//3329539458//1986//frame0
MAQFAGQAQVLSDFETNLESGLTTDEATKRRELAGSFNVISPPVNCPGWVCCLLPCIKSIPSMKAFASIKPDDAEVLRNAKWIRYDASSLVRGDIIRLDEGDIIPADCILLEVSDGELLVDLKLITGEERLKTVTPQELESATSQQKLYMGGKVVQGSATAVICAIGPDTLLAQIIREGKFPPKLLDASSGTMA